MRGRYVFCATRLCGDFSRFFCSREEKSTKAHRYRKEERKFSCSQLSLSPRMKTEGTSLSTSAGMYNRRVFPSRREI